MDGSKITYCIWTQAGVQLFKKEIYDRYQMGKNNPILCVPENERSFMNYFMKKA